MILGIDFGLKKVGLAIAHGLLAEPLAVVRYSDIKVLEEKIEEICVREKIEKVVVGVSEGKMARETREFMKKLRNELTIPVEEVDETLSSQDAQRVSREANMKRSKRRKMEDAIAAAILLQNYLDMN